MDDPEEAARRLAGMLLEQLAARIKTSEKPLDSDYTRLPQVHLTIHALYINMVDAGRTNVKQGLPSWSPIAGVVFLVATLFSLLSLLWAGPPIGSGNKVIFNTLVSFCAAGSFLGGSAYAGGRLPVPESLGGSPIQFITRGGIAVFVISLLIMTMVH